MNCPYTKALIEVLLQAGPQVIICPEIREIVNAVKEHGRELKVKNVPDEYEIPSGRYNDWDDEEIMWPRTRVNRRKFLIQLARA